MRYIYLFLFPIFLSAHPHMFIDVYLNIVEKNNKFETIEVDWVFDDMNSAILIMDYDLNRDRKFSPDEIKLFKDEVFKILVAQHHSYTYLKLNSKEIDVSEKIANFTLSIRDDKFFQLSYIIDLKKIKNRNYFELSFYDENYMSSMILKSESITGISNKMIMEDNDFYGYKLIGWL